jgi:DNA primase
VGILAEDVARVRAASDFAAIVSEHVALRRVGTRLVGLCPFHAEKTGSFYVNQAEGLYHCFGCQASGDAITFVRETQHLDFVEAVEWLASRVGITVRYDDARVTNDHKRRTVLLEAMERAVDWYHQRLLTGTDSGSARRYLRDRWYDGDVVRAFRLGWAPDDWDALSRALAVPTDVLTETGLGFVNRAGRQQDAFRARIMFPILDVGGHPVAFGGRILPGADGPKYKNSPETPIYSKRRTLYGLNWAKTGIVDADEVIVCEGYTDVIGFFRAGVPRAVATCGTALADEHFRTLKNFARRVVLAYDADAAGQGAAERFYAWEKQFELDIAVVALPDDSDPGQLAQTDPDALKVAVAEARPFLAFRVDRILGAGNLATAEGRARAAEAALEAVAEHPSDFVRDSYVMMIADRCRLTPDQLRSRLTEVLRDVHRGDTRRRPKPSAVPANATRARDDGDPGPAEPPRDFDDESVPVASVGSRPRATQSPEVEALRLAVHRPETVAPFLEELLFDDEINLAAFRALASVQTLHDAIEKADPEAAALLLRLAVEEAEAEPEDVIALLVRRATMRALTGLEAEARASQSVIDLTWPRQRMEELEGTETRLRAAEQLVAWMVRSAEEGP